MKTDVQGIYPFALHCRLEAARGCGVVLLGVVGGPSWSATVESGTLACRLALVGRTGESFLKILVGQLRFLSRNGHHVQLFRISNLKIRLLSSNFQMHKGLDYETIQYFGNHT